jgi:hypothetical protein
MFNNEGAVMKKFEKNMFDIGSLELFADFLGLKLHLFEDFRPMKSSKRCNFWSLKLTFFEQFFVLSFLIYLQNNMNSCSV